MGRWMLASTTRPVMAPVASCADADAVHIRTPISAGRILNLQWCFIACPPRGEGETSTRSRGFWRSHGRVEQKPEPKGSAWRNSTSEKPTRTQRTRRPRAAGFVTVAYNTDGKAVSPAESTGPGSLVQDIGTQVTNSRENCATAVRKDSMRIMWRDRTALPIRRRAGPGLMPTAFATFACGYTPGRSSPTTPTWTRPVRRVGRAVRVIDRLPWSGMNGPRNRGNLGTLFG
jgi:hypothetical protein